MDNRPYNRRYFLFLGGGASGTGLYGSEATRLLLAFVRCFVFKLGLRKFDNKKKMFSFAMFSFALIRNLKLRI